MSDPVRQFEEERLKRIRGNKDIKDLRAAAEAFNVASNKSQYSYNFHWMGRPIIQYPQDMFAMQELIWEIKPDLIIETGIAHGGSLLYYASLLQLLGHGEVLGVDIDIREHNRKEIEKHPMVGRVRMIQGSSVGADTFAQVRQVAAGKKSVLVVLDSNHTHEHVLAELELYSTLVTPGSYIVVFDTIVEDLPDNYLPGPHRHWSRGNNPKTAAQEFLKTHPDFAVDHDIDSKILISVAPEGYLKRIR